MTKSTNTVEYFDWKSVIYIYVCGKCRTQFMLPMEKSVTFTGACANEIIPSINRSFVYKANEGRHVISIHITFHDDLRTDLVISPWVAILPFGCVSDQYRYPLTNN